MAAQVKVTLISGQVIYALSYRMDPAAPAVPSASASPNPFLGGVYHIDTTRGWVDIPVSQIRSIQVNPGAST
jgi:hypothetical protein